MFNSAVALNEANNVVMAEKNAEASKFGYTKAFSSATVDVPDAGEVSTESVNDTLN